MILKIAWKNLWRNKLRSSVLICSIALGISAGLFLMAMTRGLNTQRIQNAIGSGLGHIQIHHPDYIAEKSTAYQITDTAYVTEVLSGIPGNKKWTYHWNCFGMAASATGGYGISLVGINPLTEQQVTSIASSITEGSYFGSSRRNQVVIGEQLARKLKVKLNNKIVLTFQDANDNMISNAFRVTGIYRTASSRFDESTVFVSRHDINNLIGSASGIHEAVVMLDNTDLQQAAMLIAGKMPELAVRTWDEVSPELGYANELMSIALSVFILIIIIAMSFGIINTMLMAVLERQRELGMLMAIGMSKARVFAMILVETLCIALIGGPAGIIAAFLGISYFGAKGIDLSSVGSGLDSLGIGSVIYTQLDLQMYIIITVTVILTSILAAVYPSARAVRLRPAEVIRKS
ncbi:MAG: ABC transporter permease [Chlorobi bacterium]|nr:MAG: ABC transporter permease [Bacteroidota bacterium]MBL1161025.1 ABC transporter permease [Chlorobiota bacterium]MBZ0194869.1 ABC transporter permease [Candidatus Kapabacteria bacterium]MCC6331855.1 ABC transporter permease [Ignavibacteria bacterium]MBV6463682.1 hypothetical protein [Chlorobiota bacterium]